MTLKTFIDSISILGESYESRDLEEYLLAVYQQVLMHEEETPTFQLIHDIFRDAFLSAPIAFDPSWLDIVEAPDRNILSQKFTHPDIRDTVNKKKSSDYAGIDYTLQVLKFQIGELHKMRGKQLENEYRYLGISSETGHDWYNFDPHTNLECGVRCIADNQWERDHTDWSLIGDVLEFGRIYE